MRQSLASIGLRLPQVLASKHARVAASAGRRLALIWGLVALLAAATLPAEPSVGLAQGAQTWDVQVSGTDSTQRLMAQSYFPGALTIHVGDTVRWRFASITIHTVTFNSGLPAAEELIPGPGPGELTLGPAFFEEGPSGPNATYDGTVRTSSGIPLGPPDEFDYRLTFTRPGLFGYVCTVHPGMRAEVEVVPTTVPLAETPAQAQARGMSTLSSLLSRMANDTLTVRSATAGTTHTALAGLGDGFGASALEFLPLDLTVRQGDTVAWTLADPFEIHTVTFTSGGPTPEFVDLRPQANGPPIAVITANVAQPVGGTTYTGQGYILSLIHI